ncbi:MAG: hypothetical protein ACK2U9_20945 [Anaerolineae bacterium]
MKARHSKLMLPWIAGTLVLILVALAGCAEVQVVDTTPAAADSQPFVSPLEVDPDRHDLAILGLDFDPPLDYQQLILRRQSVALLVVIENAGTTTERDLTIEARLTTPEDKTLSLTRQATVDSIAPGEIQIVRFDRLGKIPYHDTFYLDVSIVPVEGESDPDNNHKAFEIQIHHD